MSHALSAQEPHAARGDGTGSDALQNSGWAAAPWGASTFQGEWLGEGFAAERAPTFQALSRAPHPFWKGDLLSLLQNSWLRPLVHVMSLDREAFPQGDVG